MSQHAPGIDQPSPDTGFRVALAEYPGCGMEAVRGNYKPYAHLLLMVASEDAEVSPKICESFARRALRGGADLEFMIHQGAEHNFDDPGRKKQSNPANQRATEETMRRAEQLFAEYLLK
jgi:carboxymethylenebutenolidase